MTSSDSKIDDDKLKHIKKNLCNLSFTMSPFLLPVKILGDVTFDSRPYFLYYFPSAHNTCASGILYY